MLCLTAVPMAVYAEQNAGAPNCDVLKFNRPRKVRINLDVYVTARADVFDTKIRRSCDL